MGNTICYVRLGITMNLKTLTQVQAQTERAAHERHQASDTACEAAIGHLRQAFEQGFQEKQVLKAAHRSFIKAIGLNRQNPLPYLGLAYLQTLLADTRTALLYLQEALRCAPENEEALALLHYLSQTGHAPPTAQAVISYVPGPDTEPDDLDQLYEQLQRFIQRQLIFVTQTAGPVEPTTDPHSYQQLHQQYQALQQAWQRIQQDMKSLEIEIDTTPLQQQLRPLEISLKRHEQALNTSENLQALTAELHQQHSLTRQLLEQAQQNREPAVLEQNLELLLDHCDHLADQLDAFESQGVQTDDLVRIYESLIAQVENLRDQLDDAHSRPLSEDRS